VTRDTVRHRRLGDWFAEIKAAYEDRVLLVDAHTAELCGEIEARCQLAGRPAEPFDSDA
jgi:predicted nucleic acid-binding protein